MDNEFFSPLTVVKRLAPLCLVVTRDVVAGWLRRLARPAVPGRNAGVHLRVDGVRSAARSENGQSPGLGEPGDSHLRTGWAGRHAHTNLLGSDDNRAGLPGRDAHGNCEILGKQVRPTSHREAQGGGQRRGHRHRHGQGQGRRHVRGHRRRQSRGQGRRHRHRRSLGAPPLDGVEQPPRRGGARRRLIRRAAARVLNAALGVSQQGRDCRIIH